VIVQRAVAELGLLWQVPRPGGALHPVVVRPRFWPAFNSLRRL
jgi:hypothetical protein